MNEHTDHTEIARERANWIADQNSEVHDEPIDDRYSNERLTADLTSGAPGLERTARILLDATDDPIIRGAIIHEAHRVRNQIGGRWSDAVADAARRHKANRDDD